MTTSTTERAKEAAGTAAEEGQRVADVAKQEAGEIASEAKQQAQQLLSQAMDQVNDQSVQQRDRVVETLQSLSHDLQSMASQSGASGLATDLTREIADRCQALSSRIDGRQPQEILDDVRSFARQRPGTFLLGAMAAGVVAGRLARSAKAANASPSTQPAVTSAATQASQGLPSTQAIGSEQATSQGSPGAPDPLASESTPGQRTQTPPSTSGAGGSTL